MSFLLIWGKGHEGVKRQAVKLGSKAILFECSGVYRNYKRLRLTELI
jgi:hypothetical protein